MTQPQQPSDPRRFHPAGPQPMGTPPAGDTGYGAPAGFGAPAQSYPPPGPYGGPGTRPDPWHPGELAAPPQAPVGLAMKRRNPVAVWIGLPLITLGIYGLVWYYKIHRDMAEFDPRRQVPVAGPLLVLLLLGWTVVAPLVSFYNTGTRIAESQRSAGLPVTCSPVVGLLLCFVFGLQTLYYQVELNRVVDAYRAPEGTRIVLPG